MEAALGEFLADVIFVPSLVTTLAYSVHDAAGALLSTAVVGAVETAFLRLGLFKHSGWSTWHTVLPFPIYYV